MCYLWLGEQVDLLKVSYGAQFFFQEDFKKNISPQCNFLNVDSDLCGAEQEPNLESNRKREFSRKNIPVLLSKLIAIFPEFWEKFY